MSTLAEKIQKQKELGLFGSLSSSIKSSASSVEVAALAVNEVLTLGLMKVQAEARESLAEARGLSAAEVSDQDLYEAKQRALALGRTSYK